MNTFKITDHIEFSRNRAQCPSCLLEGKTGKNLALVPNTDGAYKCHRGCTPEQIRDAIGQPKPQIIPTAIATRKPTEYRHRKEIEENAHRLITQSKIAKQWLLDRGITEDTISKQKLGVVKRSIEGKAYPCITIPYEYPDGYLQKYFVAPWLPSEQRGDRRIQQDVGLSARFWFTRRTEYKQLWICEGEWDALLLSQYGGDFDIATTTTGAGNIPSDLSELDQYTTILIWYDLDDAGKNGADKLAAKLGDRATICTVPHPENPKKGWDVGDALLSGFKLDHFLDASKKGRNHNTKPNTVRDRLISTQELLDRAPDFVEFLVHDLITANELQIIAAPPRAGKSLLSLGLVEAVASGKEFLGRPTQQGDVIYVNCEDGDSKLKERVLAQGWDPNIPVHWLTEFSLSEWDSLLQVCEEIKPRLLVIDTLTSVRSDDTDENSSKLANLLKPLKQAAKRLNMAVVLVHHTKKLNVNNLEDVDIFDSMRGSGVIRSESRGAIILAEVPNPEARRNEWRLIAENGSYAKQDLLVVLDANTLSWKCLSNWTPNCSESQESQALAFFDKVGSATIQQLAANTSIPPKSAYTVVTRLVQRGLLAKQGTRQNAVYHRPIQQIQQLNSLLNSPNQEPASDRGSNSTKTKKYFSTETQQQNPAVTPAKSESENSSSTDFVELGAQTHTQQAFPNSTSISTEFNKPRSVRFKVGDRAEVREGFFAGRSVEVTAVDGSNVWAIAKGWIGANHFQAVELKKLKAKANPPIDSEGDEF